MAPSSQVVWVLLLAGSALLCAHAARGWAARPDAPVTLLAGGLAGLGCISLATIYASAGW